MNQVLFSNNKLDLSLVLGGDGDAKMPHSLSHPTQDTQRISICVIFQFFLCCCKYNVVFEIFHIFFYQKSFFFCFCNKQKLVIKSIVLEMSFTFFFEMGKRWRNSMLFGALWIAHVPGWWKTRWGKNEHAYTDTQ